MINLKKITEDNFIDAFDLKLGAGQDAFVSHPIRSLAQAYVYRNQCQPFGIYNDDEMVGYVMVIYDYDIPEYDIWHMMIDERHQGEGFGKVALEKVLSYIGTKPFGDSNRVTLTCNKDNEVALALYHSIGFKDTGVIDDDEIEMSMELPNESVVSKLKLVDINEDNWVDFASLSVDESQKHFLTSNIGIMARGYIYRSSRAKVIGIASDGKAVGLAMVRNMDEEPACYDLQQFMIDKDYQGNGYGTQALKMILANLEKEHKYDCVEVCVKKYADVALHVYEVAGFSDTGYIDDDNPDSLNLMYYFN